MFIKPLSLLLICLFIEPAFSEEKPPAKLQSISLDGHRTAVLGLSFSPDGKQLVTSSWREIRRWNPKTGKLIDVFLEERGYSVAFSPNGKLLVISGFELLSVFDTNTDKETHTIDAHGKWDRSFAFRPSVGSMVFSPNGKLLITASSLAKVGGRHGYPGGIVKVFNAANGKEVRRFEELSHIPNNVAISPNGKYVAACTYGAGGELPEPGEMRLWELTTGKRLWIKRLRENVTPGKSSFGCGGVAFSPDSKTLASAWADGTIRFWSVPDGKETKVLKGHDSWLGSIVYSPDGKTLAAIGGGRVVRVWDVTSGKLSHSLSFDVRQLRELAFSPDGTRLVAVGGDSFKSGAVKMWILSK